MACSYRIGLRNNDLVKKFCRKSPSEAVPSFRMKAVGPKKSTNSSRKIKILVLILAIILIPRLMPLILSVTAAIVAMIMTIDQICLALIKRRYCPVQ